MASPELSEGESPDGTLRETWSADSAVSVRQYNEWYERSAPAMHQRVQAKARKLVRDTAVATSWFRELDPALLFTMPRAIVVFRHVTAPPVARDRLSGLSGISRDRIKALEEDGDGWPQRRTATHRVQAAALCDSIQRLSDRNLMPWLSEDRGPTAEEQAHLLAVVGDRVATSFVNPMIRNAQEKRQLDVIEPLLVSRGYTLNADPAATPLTELTKGTYAFRRRVVVRDQDGRETQMPIDCLIVPWMPPSGLPVLVEAKSAGDFANPNKRRKEEADKKHGLVVAYPGIRFVLFLGGYFGEKFLEHMHAADIPWVWEHRPHDLLDLLKP